MLSKAYIRLLATVACFLNLAVPCLSRKISTMMDWGKQCNHNYTIVYTKAVGDADTLHYVYSSAPLMSLLAIKTENNAKLRLNCSEEVPLVSVDSPKTEIYSFGMIFDHIISYQDADDSANLLSSNYSQRVNYSTAEMSWNVSLSQPDANLVAFQSEKGNGSFKFSFQVSKDDRQDQLPHLLLNNNLTLLGFTVDHFPADFPHTRFALGVTYISSGKSTFKINSDKSLDDEYTPGVFRVTSWTSSEKSKPKPHKSFMQWKSVCYLTAAYDRTDSTSVQHYPFKDTTVGTVNSSIAYKFFHLKQDAAMKSSFVSFGLSGDEKYYNTTMFTAWYSVVGFGEAPEEKISVTAIIIIAVGLGLPLLLIIFGGVFLCWRKRQNDYTPVYGTIST
ncbi:glycosylated lysosomal membrane protein-like [Argonauta hians]